ncbi:Histidine protein methyltransferase 1-like [Porphyridium purpureum]|uniref:protein-histidine N-methyltransferase n=1 Tax=Porphyridium purpureum TaxID=35688 RepID=A0A5J4YTQ7_PORPP|nr:Histidine protein methyltransferase 1-like [Porphyridium purpureum]|eukprot:POR6014..scf229_5
MFRFDFVDANEDEKAAAAAPVHHTAAPLSSSSSPTVELDAVRLLRDARSRAPGQALDDEIPALRAAGLRACAGAHVQAGAVAPVGLATDLIPGVYEGGFKLWESALDLIEFLRERPEFLNRKHVLELGCGHALPGIFALRNGATALVLHDFNAEVLESCAALNVVLNEVDGAGSAVPPVRFFAGSWATAPLAFRDAHFDLVLASEVLYSEQSSRELAECLCTLFQPRRVGTVLVASKRYYFGVGGCVLRFREYLLGMRPQLKIDILASVDDGKSNIRDILSIEFT